MRGAIALAVISGVYPIFADAASRPLAVFVLPCLLTAVLGGWRPTVLVGLASLAMAVVLGVMGPLDTSALIARWLVIVAGVVMGAVGAAMREREAGRLADLGETVAVREAFERGLAPAPIIPDSFVAAARYRPAESRMHLGGDFMEAVAIADGRLAVLIGDVCGHGPREAAVGTALRAGWKGIASATRVTRSTGSMRSMPPSSRTGASTRTSRCAPAISTATPVWCDWSTPATRRRPGCGAPPPCSTCRPRRRWDSGSARRGPPPSWRGPVIRCCSTPTASPTTLAVHGPPRRWGEAGLLAWLDAQAPDASIQELADALLAAATAGGTAATTSPCWSSAPFIRRIRHRTEFDEADL